MKQKLTDFVAATFRLRFLEHFESDRLRKINMG
jgi:hypothetical protein